MNTFTKNDLSAGKVKLDYQALLKTARTALFECENGIEDELKALKNYQTCSAGLYTGAARLAVRAQEFAVVADTLVALEGGLTRKELEIVNKPPVDKV